MTTHCSARVCTSTESSLVDGKKIRFFEFPTDKKLLELWERVCRKDIEENNKNPKLLCELHFDPNSFDSNNKLLPDSVPKNPYFKRPGNPSKILASNEPPKKKIKDSVLINNSGAITKTNEILLDGNVSTKRVKPYRLTVQIDKISLRPCPKSKKSRQIKIKFGVYESTTGDNNKTIDTESLDSLTKENDNSPRNYCLVCKQVFTVPTELYVHLREHFTCDICNLEFTSKKSHNKHYKLHESTARDFPYKCHICNLLFKAKEDLKKHKHIAIMKVTTKDIQVCKICNMTFRNEVAYSNHLSEHDEKELSPQIKLTSLPAVEFNCRICNAKLSSLGEVKMHSKTHTSEKPIISNNVLASKVK